MWFWSIFEPANNFLQGMQNGPISYSWCCTKHVVFILMQHLIATGFSIAFTFEMVRVEKRKRMDDDPVTSVTSGTAERSSWSTVAEEKVEGDDPVMSVQCRQNVKEYRRLDQWSCLASQENQVHPWCAKYCRIADAHICCILRGKQEVYRIM